MRTWKRLIDDPTSPSSAPKHFEDVQRFAQAFGAAKDWPDAQTAYSVASKIAVLNLANNPSDTSWRDKAEAAEKASVEAAKTAETAPGSAPQQP